MTPQSEKKKGNSSRESSADKVISYMKSLEVERAKSTTSLGKSFGSLTGIVGDLVGCLKEEITKKTDKE